MTKREKYQYLTLTEKKEIIAALESGLTQKEIAARFCCSYLTVGNIYRQLTGSSKELIEESLSIFIKLSRLPENNYKIRTAIRGLMPRLEAYLRLKKVRPRGEEKDGS